MAELAAWSGATGTGDGQLGGAGSEHSSRVLGVIESDGPDCSGQELFGLLAVGFAAAQLGDQRPERLPAHDRRGSVGVEPTGSDAGGEPWRAD